MNDWTFRPYRASDVAEIIAVHDRALLATGAIPADPTWSDDLRAIPQHYLAPGGEFLIAVRGATMLGFGAFLPQGDGTVEIMRMRIDPPYQGQGLGRALLAQLLTTARTHGHRRAVLTTTAQQVAAQRLYERFGFTRTGTGRVHGFDTISYAYGIPDVNAQSLV